jgi:outer membrane translocation and assembly module TamA
VLGGNLAFFGRTELELPITHGVSALGFVDGGGIFNPRAGELAATTGFGLVWRSPIGPIGGYLAWPDLHGGPSFVFGIGSHF